MAAAAEDLWGRFEQSITSTHQILQIYLTHNIYQSNRANIESSRSKLTILQNLATQNTRALYSRELNLEERRILQRSTETIKLAQQLLNLT